MYIIRRILDKFPKIYPRKEKRPNAPQNTELPWVGENEHTEQNTIE